MMAYQQFIAWLDATPLSALFKATTWVVPAVQSVHILAIGVVLSVAVVLALRVVGWSARHLDVAVLAQRSIPALWWALLVLLVSGAILIIAEPTRTLSNPYFFAKMACLLVLLALIRYFQLAVQRRPLRWSAAAAAPAMARPAVASAMLLLLAIVFCGRWIAYA